MEYRNAKYNRHGTIDCEVNHPRFGWIAFTASPDDPMEWGRHIYAEVSAGKVDPYVPPPVRAPSTDPRDYPLPKWRFMAMVDYLTETGALAEGAIDAAVDKIPDAFERAKVRSRFRNSDLYNFADPLFEQLAPVVGLTMAALESAWMVAAERTDREISKGR